MQEQARFLVGCSPEAVPDCLRQERQWVCWRNKRPIDPKTGAPASSTDPATWGAFGEALAAYEASIAAHPEHTSILSSSKGILSSSKDEGRRSGAAGARIDGIGYVFRETDPYTGIDLDGRVTNGKIAGWAMRIIKRMDSYAELSVSGCGVHIIVLAGGSPQRPASRNRGVSVSARCRSLHSVSPRLNGQSPPPMTEGFSISPGQGQSALADYCFVPMTGPSPITK